MKENFNYKEMSLELLTTYKNKADELFERTTKGISNHELSEVKEGYKQLKDFLKEEEKRLKSYETLKEFRAFVLPALQDMLHNSNLLPVNHVSKGNIDKLQHSLYNISDYAGYWYQQLKGYNG
ncbi:hypothetical protein ACFFIX_06575 [Metabacillus herbersteinensis]|uniref:Uncharacterized protein n=1 Tax=Metabacillus herbersteinensis TaxID=283816 RepID=A0ABV6GBS6_9BACI